MGDILALDDILNAFDLNRALARFYRINYGNNEMMEAYPKALAQRSLTLKNHTDRENFERDSLDYFIIHYDIKPGQTFEKSWADIGRAAVQEKYNNILNPPVKKAHGGQKKNRTIKQKRRELFQEIEGYASSQRNRPFKGWSDERIWGLFHYYNAEGLRCDTFVDIPLFKLSIKSLENCPQELIEWAAYGEENEDAYRHNAFLSWAREFAEMSSDWDVFKTIIEPKKSQNN